MKAGDLVIKTHIDNSGVKKDLTNLEKEIEIIQKGIDGRKRMLFFEEEKTKKHEQNLENFKKEAEKSKKEYTELAKTNKDINLNEQFELIDNSLRTNIEYENNVFKEATKKASEYKEEIKDLQEYLKKLNEISINENIENDPELLLKLAQKERALKIEQRKLERNPNETFSYIENRKKNIAELEKEIELLKQKIKLSKEEKIVDNITNINGTEEIAEAVNIIPSKLNKVTSKLKGIGKAVISIVGGLAKIIANIITIGVLLGGLALATTILGLGFKKAFENEQIKANLDYIKFAITKALEPALNRIVDIIIKIINLLFRIMQYVQFIIYQWTGKNIFENASVDAYAASLKKAETNAKALKNQLAGFDEMEVLQDNSSGANNTTGGMPNFDLSQMTMTPDEAPGWLRWIVDNKDGILSTLAGILGYVLLTKLGLKDIKALGIVLLIEGVIKAIKELKAYLEDPTWEHFGGVIEGIGLAIIGLGLLFLGLPGIITGVIILIVGMIYKHWNEIQAFLQRGIDWLKEKGTWIRERFGNLVGDLYDRFVRNLQLALNWLSTIMGLIKNNFDEIISFVKNVFTGNWQAAWQNVKNIFYNIWLGIKATAETLLKQIINGALGMLEHGINKPIDKINQLTGAINNIPGVSIPKISRISLPRLAKGTILNNPGKGVPVAGGRAIAGEAGREAYLPLSDEQLLEELGSSIGRHVTINLTNITQMNGRILNRELKRVQNDQDFAFNG